MAELMIVNPRRKKRKSTRKRKARRPRTKTRTVTKTVYKNRGRRRNYKRRARRNPRRGGLFGVNLMDLAGGTAIGIGSRLLPGMLARYGIPLPATGYMGYLSQLGSGLALSYLVGNILKMKSIARKGTEITMALVLERVINDMLLARPEVAGLLGYGKAEMYMEGAGLKGLAGMGQDVYEVAAPTGDSASSRFKKRFGARDQLN